MSEIGVVVIGRNEGTRLARCLSSVQAEDVCVVYVDSGSTDDSAALARARGAAVVELEMSQPFTAARGRNAGFAELLRRHPGCQFVQFVDGDCELAAGWLDRGRDELAANVGVAIACGRLRERDADASIYNRLCDLEWNGPTGDVDACGGICMIRATAFRAAGGFRDGLVAGEEPELCLRLRTVGWKIRRLDAEMGLHDADITRFAQWWKRAVRAGWAYAECSRLRAGRGDRLWVKETRSVLFWGLLLPMAIAASAWFAPAFALALVTLYPLLAFRVVRHRRQCGNCPRDAWLYAIACVVAKFAQATGAISYLFSRTKPSRKTAVAYLVNQYPHVSHSFIRREIRALTDKGIRVARFTIRWPGVALVDRDDLAEQALTEALLDVGVIRLIGVCLATVLCRPIRWSRALVQAFRMARRSGRGLHRHLAYLAEACLLARRLRHNGIRHVHAHFGTNATDVAFLTRTLDDVTYSFTIHGPEEFDRPESLSLGEKISRAAFVVTVSEFGRSQAMRWCAPEHWSKLHVVHCGVDESFLDAAASSIIDAPRLVCVGRLCEQKGQMLLLQAVARLKEYDVHLTLAGDGPMRSLLEAEIERLGLAGRVEITGWIANDEVRRLLTASRAMILPSFAEGLPLVLMEALALGRPVVSTYVAGIPELVRPQSNGWLVPAGSVSALTEVLRQVLTESPARLTEMGRAGASWVRSHHDVRIEADKLATLFGLGEDFDRGPDASRNDVTRIADTVAPSRNSTPGSRPFEGSRS